MIEEKAKNVNLAFSDDTSYIYLCWEEVRQDDRQTDPVFPSLFPCLKRHILSTYSQYERLSITCQRKSSCVPGI